MTRILKIIYRSGLVLSGLAVVGALCMTMMVGASMLYWLSPEFENPYTEKKEHIAILNVSGPIMASEPLLKFIHQIKLNEACKGILVRINSPGGAAAASQEIYQELLEAGKEKKIVVSMGNTAASGGYYIALAGEKIFASRATITGSIGVIAQFPKAYELFEKLGVSMSVVKSGKFKDAGSFHRPSTREDTEYFQGVIDDTHHQFVFDLRERRALDQEKAEEVTDGRIFTGQMALEHHLIDTLGGYYQARDYLVAQAKIEGEPLYVEPREPPAFLDGLSSKLKGPEGISRAIESLLQSGLFYLWPAAWAPLG